jgi:ATP-dependent HslUV protease ATP-binding subunit HslU
MEKILEEISFTAADNPGTTIIIDDKYVDFHLSDLIEDEDVSRYIL